MATVDIKIVRADAVALNGTAMPLAQSSPSLQEILTPSGSSQTSAVVAPKAESSIWLIKAIGAAVRVAFGTTPTADNASGWHISDGETLTVAASAGGEKVAVILAS